MGRVVGRSELFEIRQRLKNEGKTVVFTNGCFDILHRGHVEYLASAKAMGDVLIVGVNTDDSVRRIKGDSRPVVGEEDRALVVAALASVDYVTLFGEDTPLELIRFLVPDILVKGADWPIEKVVGRDIVEAAGGSVKTISIVPNRSTSAIIQKILHSVGSER
ncbi:MAG TPA: D-glycero-beta-D-manno-heptose 1-phosphate adenylyltransferase [Bacteroidota bacterium]|nr:D-glycero-beta-D-manno-heptose 1-phosphate adenylyltransferase [Bacteroidota bacterium]